MNSWIKKYVLLQACLVFSTFIFSQFPGIKSFKIEEGGDPVKILTIYKSNQGYIYTGTSKGLYKFDGIKFTQVLFQNALSNPAVTAIFQDAQDQLWVGMQSGDIAKLTNNYLKIFTPQEGNPKKPITAFLQDKKNNLWFSTDGEGIYYIANNHLYNINTQDGLSENSVYALTLTESGEVIAGTDQGISICKISGAKKQVFNLSSKNGLPDNFVKAITPAGNNTFWIGMQDKGLCLYNNNTKQFSIPPALALWKDGQINQVLQAQNTLWIATENNGVLKLTGSAKALSAMQFSNEPKLNINNILQDNEGNIWLLANNYELIKTPGDQFKLMVSYTKNEFANVHAILCDKQNNIWQGTERGIIKYFSDNISASHKYIISELNDKTDITALYEDIYNRIWIGTMGKGVFLLDEKTGAYRNINEDKLIQKSSVLSITGKDNMVFVSSLEGAAAFTPSIDVPLLNTKYYFTNYTNISSIGSNYIYDIFKDRENKIWFATDGKGISVMQYEKFTNYNEKNGLKDEVIYSITEDLNGNIWFSTHSAGVYKFDGKTFTNYSIANGLSDINISAVKTDKQGNILIVYKKGIDVLNPQTGQVTYLNAGEGIKQINVQDLGAVSQDTSGGIFVSTTDGIIYYHPLPNTVHRPQTILESAILFPNPLKVNASHNFNYNENSFSFSFVGIYYSDPESVHYQYKLEGFTNEWIATMDKNIIFPKLPPGKYTFRVRSSINQNFSGANEAFYEFNIETPFYTAWWFIAACLIVTGSLIYWYIKSREKDVKKVERLQQEKIKFQFETLRNQVNPHFLFNSFNTLISIIEENPAMAVEYVEQLSDFFRNIVNYRDKDIIPLREEIELLKTYFFIQQKRFGRNLELNNNLSLQQKNQTFIPPLTLQLLAENAIKHNAVSKEAPLKINISIEDERLVISNNINPKISRESGAGMGLQNITNRYTLLSKQNVSIKNGDNQFIVSLPILKQKV